MCLCGSYADRSPVISASLLLVIAANKHERTSEESEMNHVIDQSVIQPQKVANKTAWDHLISHLPYDHKQLKNNSRMEYFDKYMHYIYCIYTKPVVYNI